MGKKNSNYNGKSGGAGFLITLGAAYLLFHGIPGIVLGVLLGAGVGFVASVVGKKLDTTTHNKEDVERERQEAARREAAAAQERARQAAEQQRKAAMEVPLTGDAAADSVITRGLEMLETIRTENVAIPDETLSAQMNTLTEKCLQIFRTVSEAPSKAPQVRKFMNYYLPTTLKMLANYRTMQDRGVSYNEMNQARETAIKGMNMVLTACQKQIDNLHRENMLDISTDIDVMEQMLKRDGYTENEITGNKSVTSGARTAAEAQMRKTSVPVMDFPSGENSEDISSSSASATQHRF